MNCSLQSRITGPATGSHYDMASSTSSQHRRVFVGNIPYNASEEQLIEICEIAGPVVSFRLVLDRESGKPKGYGFCEYLDEETALSARRNLQGHWINGRQLRVDFAGNDKGPDRKRNRDGSQNLSSLQHDPVTQYLAKMSREQLTEIMSEMNSLAVQNNAFAQQLLQGCPQLPQALLQAQVRLGMVPPQMMQMPSSSSVPNPALQTSDVSEVMNHRSKRPKLEEHSSFNADRLQQRSEKRMSQFSPDVESALLEQVISMTPEQISSLPVEEQQQVLQLQAQMQV